MIILDDIYIQGDSSQKNAGSKARKDIIDILAPDKIMTIRGEKTRKYLDQIRFIKKVLSISAKETVLVQYPFYFLNEKISDIVFKILKKYNTIALVHDLNSLRYTPDNFKKIKHEIDSLNNFKVVISHNKHMTQWLKSNGLTTKVVDLGVFDYLGCGISNSNCKYDLAYAGNLLYDKTRYIYDVVKLNTNINFEFFGVGFKEDKLSSTNYMYQGSRNPEELISSFSSKFGLVWDGDSVKTCNGLFGNYLKYNNPHKLSMFISAQIPVITWKEAAIADFVLENDIGLVVDSLENLEGVLKNITENQYLKMKENIGQLSNLVKNGHYTKLALDKAIDSLNNN